MNVYEALSLKIAAGKDEPAVWVSRLVIYQTLTPNPVFIREVKLSRGLNIVWAEEPDNDDTTAEIRGHSAGKTSFCRLLRYALGEKTCGTKANAKLLQDAMPLGYVGAELHVAGKQWAVIRPFDKARRSYLMSDASIEALVQDRKNGVGHDEYVEQLGLNAVLERLETATVVRSDQPIEWGHVLAWCARDQEARFQNIHDWRSTRSESEWPAFKASKADALFVMRAVLGLFLPDELKGEEELAASLKQKEGLENKVAELKREPQFRVNLYERMLKDKLAAALPDRKGIHDLPLQWDQLAPDLTRLTAIASERLRAEARQAEEDRKAADDQIDDLGAEVRQLERQLQMTAAAFDLEGAAATEVVSEALHRQQLRDKFDEYADQMCPMGGVTFGECDYVSRQRDGLTITQLQDQHAMDQAEAERSEIRRRLREHRHDTEERLRRLRAERQGVLAQRGRLEEITEARRYAVRELNDILTDLVGWTAKATGTGEFKELDEASRTLKDVEARVEQLGRDLTALLSQHDASRELIASIFSRAVQAVLSSGTYDGRVSLDERELRFQIVHGTAMSGEAVETLSVLLADVACLIYNSVSDRVLLPGFLLHDSPREADLSRRVYRSFIRLIASLQEHFGSADACPFQYIITTTTDPPEELRNETAVKLHLNAGVTEELLFRRSLAAVAEGRGTKAEAEESLLFPNTSGDDENEP